MKHLLMGLALGLPLIGPARVLGQSYDLLLQGGHVIMGAVPRSRRGIASGILATSRTVGMGVGVALAGIILPRALENSQKAGSPEAILGASAGGFAVAAAIALLTAMICSLAARSQTTSLS